MIEIRRRSLGHAHPGLKRQVDELGVQELAFVHADARLDKGGVEHAHVVEGEDERVAERRRFRRPDEEAALRVAVERPREGVRVAVGAEPSFHSAALVRALRAAAGRRVHARLVGEGGLRQAGGGRGADGGGRVAGARAGDAPFEARDGSGVHRVNEDGVLRLAGEEVAVAVGQARVDVEVVGVEGEAGAARDEATRVRQVLAEEARHALQADARHHREVSRHLRRAHARSDVVRLAHLDVVALHGPLARVEPDEDVGVHVVRLHVLVDVLDARVVALLLADELEHALAVVGAVAGDGGVVVPA
mmetsp:Transcript_26721/g.62377  ORF Transcript_26721/g.62377 Transcript_26721/m.62377 type:complete len:304 (-) Transcript_26721:1213-2124(-)